MKTSDIWSRFTEKMFQSCSLHLTCFKWSKKKPARSEDWRNFQIPCCIGDHGGWPAALTALREGLQPTALMLLQHRGDNKLHSHDLLYISKQHPTKTPSIVSFLSETLLKLYHLVPWCAVNCCFPSNLLRSFICLVKKGTVLSEFSCVIITKKNLQCGKRINFTFL